MKKNRKKIILVSTLILTTILSVGAVLYLKNNTKISASSNSSTPVDDSSKNQASTNTENSSAVITPIKTAQPSNTVSKIPILMYHYVRDYTNPSDSIGVNLSVSPSKFASQLDYLQSQGYKTITFRDVESGKIPTKPIILTFDDGYLDFYTNAYPELRKRQMVAVSYVVTSLNGGVYINDSQIKELDDYGIEIGSHTISHPNLTVISSAKARSEISNSETVLEDLIGKPIISFCYPSGKYDETISGLVKTAGYKYATTTKSGIADFSTPYTLSRYRIGPSTNISSLIK